MQGGGLTPRGGIEGLSALSRRERDQISEGACVDERDNIFCPLKPEHKSPGCITIKVMQISPEPKHHLLSTRKATKYREVRIISNSAM